MFEVMPDDPKIIDMDPVQKIWMYNNWEQDQLDRSELAKNHAYLVGSFHNPEAVQKMLSKKGSHESSDEDFDKSTEMVMQDIQKSKITSNQRKRQKKKRRLRK